MQFHGLPTPDTFLNPAQAEHGEAAKVVSAHATIPRFARFILDCIDPGQGPEPGKGAAHPNVATAALECLQRILRLCDGKLHCLLSEEDGMMFMVS